MQQQYDKATAAIHWVGSLQSGLGHKFKFVELRTQMPTHHLCFNDRFPLFQVNLGPPVSSRFSSSACYRREQVAWVFISKLPFLSLSKALLLLLMLSELISTLVN